jgi:hypothetical protein
VVVRTAAVAARKGAACSYYKENLLYSGCTQRGGALVEESSFADTNKETE